MLHRSLLAVMQLEENELVTICGEAPKTTRREVLAELSGGIVARTFHDRRVLPAELGSAYAKEPVSVGWILAVEYVPGSDWSIQEVPQSEALMILLRNTPHAMAESPGMVDCFLKAVSEAKCFAGQRGNAIQGADQILHLIGAPA